MNERDIDHRVDFIMSKYSGGLNNVSAISTGLNSSAIATSRRLLSRSGSKTKTGGSGATDRNGDPMRSRQLFDR